MNNKIGPKISYLLRHNPDGLKMDKEGYVFTTDLLSKVGITMDELQYIVDNNDKKRFGFNTDKSKIKAFQGHSSSLGIKIKYKEIQFPGVYYHGTSPDVKNIILKHGLKPQTREYVHLSLDIPTAINVGNRHIKRGETVIVFSIDGYKMKQDGLKLYISENGVILAKEVPAKYLNIL